MAQANTEIIQSTPVEGIGAVMHIDLVNAISYVGDNASIYDFQATAQAGTVIGCRVIVDSYIFSGRRKTRFSSLYNTFVSNNESGTQWVDPESHVFFEVADAMSPDEKNIAAYGIALTQISFVKARFENQQN